MAGSSPIQVEAWTEYAIGMVIIFIRIAHRVSLVGRKWEGDDYFIIAAAFFLTGECVMLELIGQWGSIIGLKEETALSLTEDEKRVIIMGSKANIAGWCLYISLIWSLKACMLFFYSRLTLQTTRRRLLLLTTVACIVTYITMLGVIFFRCHPFEKNWQIYPYPGDSCGSLKQLTLSLVITNVTTDLLIISIPLPLLWTVRLPLLKKFGYALWLTTGIFVIAATLLRCILTLIDASQISAIIWSIRETFVGIIAVNMPVIGPLLIRNCEQLYRRIFPKKVQVNQVQPSIVTIGRKSIKLRGLKGKHSPYSMPGWSEIDTSQEHIHPSSNT